MKKSNFLKFIMLIMMTLVSLTFNSCESVDNRPACEKNNTGTFVIINNSIYAMIVDIDDGYGWFGERTIGPHGSATFTNVSVGSVTVYEYDPITGEAYWNSYVGQCKTTEFTITINKKKVTDLNDIKFIESNQDFKVNANPPTR